MHKKVISKIKAPPGYSFRITHYAQYRYVDVKVLNSKPGSELYAQEYKALNKEVQDHNNYIQNNVDLNGAYIGEKKVEYGTVRISLINSKNKGDMGYVNLVRNTYTGSMNTHSQLHPNLRNKGFGTLLYARAIQWALENGYPVRNSGGSSEMAQRVWRGKSIRKFFRIVTHSYRKNTKDRNADIFYAYPLLKKVTRKTK